MASEMEDEDEVLLALAEELGKLIDYVGGKENSHVLILPLETLCAMEEALVREKVMFSASCLVSEGRTFPKHGDLQRPLYRRSCVIGSDSW